MEWFRHGDRPLHHRDDDASLTRMYILAKKKVDISTDLALWRLMCNNYNPTFDAFYVRPSLYNAYVSDNDYVGSSWQRTNNISKGLFATLVYVPETYGECDGVNIVSAAGGTLHTQVYRMPGDKDYVVPYSFMTDAVQNTRQLQNERVYGTSYAPTTTCLPYYLDIPAGLCVYELTGREAHTLVFSQVTSRMKAKKPYMVRVVKASSNGSATSLSSNLRQEIPASHGIMIEPVDVLGLRLEGTFNAINYGDALLKKGISVLQSDGNWHPLRTTITDDNQPQVMPFSAYLLTRGYLGTFYTEFSDKENEGAWSFGRLGGWSFGRLS